MYVSVGKVRGTSLQGIQIQFNIALYGHILPSPIKIRKFPARIQMTERGKKIVHMQKNNILLGLKNFDVSLNFDYREPLLRPLIYDYRGVYMSTPVAPLCHLNYLWKFHYTKSFIKLFSNNTKDISKGSYITSENSCPFLYSNSLYKMDQTSWIHSKSTIIFWHVVYTVKKREGKMQSR